MRYLLVSALLACAAVCASTEAHADEAPAKPYTLSATFSPIHLLLPVFEVSVEPYILPHFTMSAIAGYGSVKVDNVIGQSFKFSVLELGAQARGYLNASNDGLHLGVEALYIKVDTSDNSVGTVKVSGTGSGLAAGPLLGYKLLTRVGFTFEAQGGVQFGLVSAEAKASDGTTQAQDSDSESKIFPLLNLNIGWTF